MTPPYSALLVASLSIFSVSAQAQDSGTYTDDKKFQDTTLSVANRFRDEHGAAPLTWNGSLADNALDWAKQCRWRYESTPSGETLAMAFPDVGAAVESWGNQRDRYNFDHPGFTFDTNDFTQLVWQNSESIGCARHDCGPVRPGDDDRFDRPDYDRNDAYDREDDIHDDWHDDRRDDWHDDWRDDRDDRNKPRDDDDGDNDNCDPDDDGDDDCHGDPNPDDDDDSDRARGWFVVCRFSPPGNIIGGDSFENNVLPQGSAGGGNGGNGGSGNGGGGNGGGGNGGSNPQAFDDAATSHGGAKVLALLGFVVSVIGMM